MIAAQSALTRHRVPDYSDIKPLPDPPTQPDMMEQYPCIHAFFSALSSWFRRRDDVFIGSGGYLWVTPDDKDGPYPDGTFAEGLDGPERIVRRNGYVISEVGKPPDLVLEVGSESTGRRDYTVKREMYAGYGVREYWRFDPSGGEYHDSPLGGDRLADEKYEPIEIASESDSRHWGYSEVLGLELWWDDGEIRFRDPAGGEFLRTFEESEDALESERAARLVAERRAESERVARMAAEARMAEMESELRHLRGE